MKRYLIFAGYNYYPEGGSHDFMGSADEPKTDNLLPEIREQIRKCDWVHALDTEIENGEVIDL